MILLRCGGIEHRRESKHNVKTTLSSDSRFLCNLSLDQLVKGLRSGVFTSQQIVESCLNRIQLRNSVVHGWANLVADDAILTARLRDKEPIRGPLHGIPFAVKDVFKVESAPISYGADRFERQISEVSAHCVETLIEAGGVFLGKTVTAEFALYKPGPTRNPHNLGHTPGGSSSGSAAVVADFQVPFALGTQTAGSIVRPASYCGVYGFKPTFGRYDRTGVLETSASLDTVGFFCRSSIDALLVDGVLAVTPALSDDSTLADNYTIGIFRDEHASRASPDSLAAMETFVASLISAGLEVKEVSAPERFLGLNEAQKIVHKYEASISLPKLKGFNLGAISPSTKAFLEEAAYISVTEYQVARDKIFRLRRSSSEVFQNCDVLVTLAAQGPAPQGIEATGDPMFNRMWTALGLPAVSFPAHHFPGGLPIGLQLVGKEGADEHLLKLLNSLVGIIKN